MRGGNLRRFRPDTPQDGQGMKDLLKEIVGNAMKGAAGGLKSSPNPLRMPFNVASGAKRGLKRGLKRGIEKEIQRQASKRLKDIFGE